MVAVALMGVLVFLVVVDIAAVLMVAVARSRVVARGFAVARSIWAALVTKVKNAKTLFL